MLLREAMQVFWRSLRDAWDEFLPLAAVNLLWFVAWAAPFAIIPSAGSPALIVALLVLGLGLGSVSTPGLFQVADRVARGRSAGFEDWLAGFRAHWVRALIWLLGNVLVVLLVGFNIQFYGTAFEGEWVALMQGIWLALALFWLTMQLYFWPMLLQLEQPRCLTAWRYSAMLIVSAPIYTFLLASFVLVCAVLSVLTGVILALAGGSLLSLLCTNGLLVLLFKLGKIQDPRPPLAP